MSAAPRKPRLAVVSPFLTKSGGTERPVTEGIARLTSAFEIHVYSQSIEDVDLSQIRWHRIPKLAGPHLLNFSWWYVANHVWRAWDRVFRGLHSDLTYSSGANCLNADVISVPIVFAEYVPRVKSRLRFLRNPLVEWPRLMHRRIYYRLALIAERLAYKNPRTKLFGISRRVGKLLAKEYGRREDIPVLYTGIDHEVFNPQRRLELREAARRDIGIPADHFVLLVIGNDWRNKGVPALVGVISALKDLPIELLVVSGEAVAIQDELLKKLPANNMIRVLPPRRDVEFYYAAADAYVGPSLEDAFALPVAEAMACGLPVVTSAQAGAAEIIRHGIDGLVLDDPRDSDALATMVRQIVEDREFRENLASYAASTAKQYTWERAGRELAAILDEALRRKSSVAAQTMVRER